ncbi:MAG: hypothetical protein HQ580_11065 [Planctomycetes bacterium]|nr:hypothetical protein [Planctomycetota bacterium]
MKSFIRVITIIIALALIPAVSATAQITPPAPIKPASRPNDVLMQLRTVLSAQTQQSGGGKVLVIPTAEIKHQDMVTLMEDMTVMCRIFDKKLAQSNLVPGMHFIGRMTFPSLGDRSMGAMYVQGYGALFMTTVDFPLSPPPQTEEQEETEEEDADPVWEQMKQEMFSPEEAVRYTPDRQGEKYDARKVKNLKSTLIKALVHTANIRGLKPDELVVLTVTGKAGRSPNVVIQANLSTSSYIVSDKNKNIIRMYKGGLPDELAYSFQTVLIIRAKKSYIDAFAQNKVDFDQFREKIQLISYSCLGENLDRGSFPSFWPGATTGVDPLGSSSAGRSSRRSESRTGSRSRGMDEMGQSSSDRRRGR